LHKVEQSLPRTAMPRLAVMLDLHLAQKRALQALGDRQFHLSQQTPCLRRFRREGGVRSDARLL
jgi:hypothetical protein